MSSSVFKILTLLSIVGLGVYLGIHYSGREARSTAERPTEPSPEAVDKRATLEDISLGAFGIQAAEDDSEESVSESPRLGHRELTLRVGVIGAIPDRGELTTLPSLPYTRSEIRRAYADARDRSCRLLTPGVAVSIPAPRIEPGVGGSIGRTTVLTIGLEHDRGGLKKLPTITRSQVNKYFATHRLAVQPVLYHDSRGRPYFGTDCQAAFYEIDRPGLTVKAEPMIESAISRFRVLGIIDVGVGDLASVGRTLALAFTFAQADETLTGAADATRTATELLLLHLPSDAVADDPGIQIFVTSDDRTNLHRLETRGMTLNSPIPTISSDIQFNKTVLMGMYPADPVVTGIRYRSAGILSMDTIRKLCQPGKDQTAISLTEVLDQFGKLAGTASTSLGR